MRWVNGFCKDKPKKSTGGIQGVRLSGDFGNALFCTMGTLGIEIIPEFFFQDSRIGHLPHLSYIKQTFPFVELKGQITPAKSGF